MAVQIDEKGFYVWGSDIPDYQGEQTATIILEPVPGGFWHPRWDGQRWIEGLTPEEIAARQPPPEPNWHGLLENLRATALFGKVYMAAQNNLSVNVGYTTLIATLMSREPNVEDLKFSMQEVQRLLGTELNNEDIAFANRILGDHNFPFTI